MAVVDLNKSTVILMASNLGRQMIQSMADLDY